MGKIDVYCSDEQEAYIKARAKSFGESASGFLLLCSNAVIDIRVGVDPIIKNLESLEGLFNRGIISQVEATEIKKSLLEGDSKPLISVKKR